MKIRTVLIIVAIAVAMSAATSCRKPAAPANEQRYDLKGKVVAVDVDKHLVTVAHEDIKDFMPGMTMPFTLPDEAALNYLKAGDDINATLVVDGSQSWLENVAISRESTDAPVTTGVPEAKAGDEVPSYTLVNQDGKDIKLGDYRGKALLITFIYTR